MKRFILFSLLITLPLTACGAQPMPNITATPEPTYTPAPTSSMTPAGVGAGFRFSTYGPDYDPGVEYWASVGERMAAKFPNAQPQAIWIVGNYAGAGPILTFP